MNITRCKECGCTKTAEDRVADLQAQVERLTGELSERGKKLGRVVLALRDAKQERDEANRQLADGMGKALVVELGLRAEVEILKERAEKLAKDIETLREIAHEFFEGGKPITREQLDDFCAVGLLNDLLHEANNSDT